MYIYSNNSLFKEAESFLSLKDNLNLLKTLQDRLLELAIGKKFKMNVENIA